MKTFRFSLLKFFGIVALVVANQAVLGEELSEAPVEAPEEMMGATEAPSPEPTFKEGDAPVAIEPGDIEQPVFEAPVAPPLISEAGRIDGVWMATSVAIVLATAL